MARWRFCIYCMNASCGRSCFCRRLRLGFRNVIQTMMKQVHARPYEAKPHSISICGGLGWLREYISTFDSKADGTWRNKWWRRNVLNIFWGWNFRFVTTSRATSILCSVIVKSWKHFLLNFSINTSEALKQKILFSLLLLLCSENPCSAFVVWCVKNHSIIECSFFSFRNGLVNFFAVEKVATKQCFAFILP